MTTSKHKSTPHCIDDRPGDRHAAAMNRRTFPALAVSAALLSSPALAEEFKREQDLSAKEGQPAPALVADQWINTPEGKALDLKDLVGKVVVIDFWGTW